MSVVIVGFLRHYSYCWFSKTL